MARRADQGSTRAVRVRLTAVAVVTTSLVLLLASVALVLVFERSLTRTADELAVSRAEELVSLAERGGLPTELGGAEDSVAQVVGGDGAVLAASANVEGAPALTGFVPEHEDAEVLLLDDAPDDDETEDYRVWALRGSSPDGPVVAYAGSSRESVVESVTALVQSLAVGLPLLLVLLAALSWFLVGRTLRPVDAAARRQRRFVSDASHELQSPLSSFRAQLEVAMAAPDSTDWPATARDLMDDGDRMERMVRDLLYLARDDELATPAQMRLLDLDDVVLEEVARLRPHATASFDTSGVSAAPVHGHRDDLVRMVRNVLENADRHARERVEVVVRADAAGAELVVHDDGPGVAAEDRAQIFERFYRTDPARSQAEGGTGLGLAIVASIAGAHGGTVELTPGGAGARFVVRLPAP